MFLSRTNFVYSYSWHSFYYDLGHSFKPSHGLLCVSIPTRSDSALIAPISQFISGVIGKLPIPTPTGGPVPTPSPGELVFLMWDVTNIARKYFLFSSSLSLLSLTIAWQCQSYNCCVKFLVYISVRFAVIGIHTHKTVLASLSSRKKQALIDACFVNPLTFHP